jgi:hypothetical protein
MLRKPEPVVAFSNPCPCGSERKYKRCCWASERREYATALHAIRDVHDAGFSFALELFPEIIERTQDEFFQPAIDALGEDEVRKICARTEKMIVPNMIDAFLAESSSNSMSTTPIGCGFCSGRPRISSPRTLIAGSGRRSDRAIPLETSRWPTWSSRETHFV